MTEKFKPGDRVICICENEPYFGELNTEYIVKHVDTFGDLVLDKDPDRSTVDKNRFARIVKRNRRKNNTLTPNGLPTDSDERKKIPIYSGVIRYFPNALARIAQLSLENNRKHNPTGPLRWNRAVSGDELDALSRHLIDEDWAEVAWRALANLQKQEEVRLGITPPSDEEPTDA